MGPRTSLMLAALSTCAATLEHTIERPGNTITSGLPSAPSLFTALPEQLGLELVRKKVPLPYAIVEAVDRTPSGN